MQIIEVVEAGMKSIICNDILRKLPEWFGVESSIIDYVDKVRDMPFYAAYDNHTAIGFVTIKIHNPFSAEVCVMGVLNEYQHQGIGTLLIGQSEHFCRENGFQYLTVKTLADTVDYKPYEKARNFYSKAGFIPLEIFPLYWDEANPCLFLAKRIESI